MAWILSLTFKVTALSTKKDMIYSYLVKNFNGCENLIINNEVVEVAHEFTICNLQEQQRVGDLDDSDSRQMPKIISFNNWL